MRVMRGTFGVIAAVLGTVVLGCSEATGPDAALDVETADHLVVSHYESGLLFIQRNAPAETSMAALYQGPITRDEAGCMRREPDAGVPVAVVWPFGFDVHIGDDAIAVLDGQDEVVGTVGDEFELAGGIVDSLHDGLGFTDADRALAQARCPGKFWVVADPGL